MRNIFYQTPFIAMINPIWITLLALLFTASSCKKEEEPKHHDVVTATINGKPWKADCEEPTLFGCHIADLQYYPNVGSFSLRASNIDESIGLVIWLFDVYDTGNYTINNGYTCGGYSIGEGYCETWKLFISQDDQQEIHINKIDIENKIIEGHFHFIGRDTSFCRNDKIHIKDGYFKMKYRP